MCDFELPLYSTLINHHKFGCLLILTSLLGTGCRIHVTPAATVTGESGITLPSPSVHEIMNQQWGEMPTDERQSLPPVGYERLWNEISAANTGTPVYSSPQLNAATVAGPFRTSLHDTSKTSGLLSDEEFEELKENSIRILQSCDGQSLELQRFKKVYRDTFGKRFLKPKKLEKVMPALDEVIAIEQSGGKVNIKLRSQAEKGSDSGEFPQSVSDNLGESRAIRNDPSVEDTALVITP